MKNLSEFINEAFNESILASTDSGRYGVLDNIMQSIYRPKYRLELLPGHTKKTLIVIADSGEKRYIKFGKFSAKVLKILEEFDGILIEMRNTYCYPLSVEFEGITGNVDLSFLDFSDAEIANNTENTYGVTTETNIKFENCRNFSISKLPKLDNNVHEVALSLWNSSLTSIPKQDTQQLSFYSMCEYNSSDSTFTDLDKLSDCNFNSFHLSGNYFETNNIELTIAEENGKIEYVDNVSNEIFDSIIEKRIVEPVKLTASKQSNISITDSRLRFRNLRRSNKPEYKYMLVRKFK